MPKSGRSSTTQRPSKSTSVSKKIPKKTKPTGAPAEGLEAVADESNESELELDNELEEETALNELVEQAQRPEVQEEEVVQFINFCETNFVRCFLKGLNQIPKLKLL